MKRDMGFPLSAFLFPRPVCHGKATLWVSGQAQGRDTVCIQDRVSALVLARGKASILWLFFICSRLRWASL